MSSSKFPLLTCHIDYIIEVALISYRGYAFLIDVIFKEAIAVCNK